MGTVEAEGRPSGDPAALIASTGRVGRRAAVGWAVWQAAKPAVNKARSRWIERTTYTITVPGIDEVYPDLHEWVLSLIPTDERRALIAETGRRGDGYLVEDSPSPRETPRAKLRYDGSRTQRIVLDGHDIEVEVNRDEMKGGRDNLPENWRLHFERIVFRTRSAAGRDAIVAHIDRLLEIKRKKPGPPPFMLADRWGQNWDRRFDLPARTLESIVLKHGQLERLVGDLGGFLAVEADYARRCLPWHRGYLFHGGPGTGKSSVAKALANHFDLPLYYLPLGDLKEDAALMSLIGRVQPRSILLLEDVDVYHAATSRDDEGRVTLSALLNALDGIWTPNGLITIMTTNDKDALDPALIRPGRVDVDEHFANLDAEQASRLWRWYHGPGVEWPGIGNGWSPAAMIQKMST